MALGDWLWIAAGSAALLAGAILLAWGLLGDWAARLRRGRTRRCPRCWYSMEATEGRRCPECGREARSERRMLRSRRRWRAAAAGVIVAMAGAAAIAWPLSAGGAWKKWVPDTALIVMLPWTEEAWPLDELHERIWAYQGSVHWARSRALWPWQWELLSDRLLDVMESDRPAKPRTQAFWLLAHTSPRQSDGRVGRILAEWLGDEDPQFRWHASLGLDKFRFELAGSRDLCLEALATADGEGHRNLPEQLQHMRERLPAIAAPHELGPPPAQPPTPDEVAAALSGAESWRAVHVLSDLGASMKRKFTEGDLGPLSVDRFDLDLDGRPGLDTILRVGERTGAFDYLIVFVRRAESWRFVEAALVQSLNASPPEPRIEVTADGRRWLVVNCGEHNPLPASRGVWMDAWLEVTADGLRPVLDTGAANLGWIALRSIGATTRFVAAAQDARLTMLGPDEWPAAFEYELRASYRIDPAQLGSPPDAAAPPQPIILFEDTGRIRFRWDSAARAFVIDPAASTWTTDDTFAAVHDEPDDFLMRHADRLHALAASDDPWVQAWLVEFLSLCNDGDDKRRIQSAMGAAS